MNFYDEVEDITKKLVSISSVNKAPGEETAVAEYIYDFYGNLPYFKEHPQRRILQKTEDDFLERHNALSFVKGTKDGGSPRTVILLGHIDTVGVEDFGDYSSYATKADKLPEILKKHFDLSEEVLQDIDSQRYLFGRGALDMKAGVAGHMAIIKYFSENPHLLKGNLIALHECDEEDNSKGVITGLDLLVELREQEGFEYIACINADYSTNHSPGDTSCYIYYGSIGKLLPCCSVFGKEAHVGQPFAAFDPNFLSAVITKNISLNPRLCDLAQGELTVPPISLKQSDLKPEYTVQTALHALSYYNIFSHGKSPLEVLGSVKEIVDESYDEALELLSSRYKEYCALANIEHTPLPWKKALYTWEELYSEVKAYNPNFDEELNRFKNKLHSENPAMDLRLYSHEVVRFTWSRRKVNSPGVVLYFASVYSARIEMTGRTEKERDLLSAVEKSIDKVRPTADRELKTRYFYPYISDSSFMAICDGPEAIDGLGRNMPSWGKKYTHPTDKILQINVPVVNIGSFGKDGHMLTERVDKKQTFDNVPAITTGTILALLD
ncbi:MAG: M20/M25/M40 family metallo-hydrolase [Tissierellia bacterium]|nr:M20/M25/M40 family metallo-hydrolase [Tissierellia bacterium]